MPPIARLTPDQALYQFISGYTSKIAGTEVGPGQGAGDHLQRLLRRAVHGAPPVRLRRPAEAQDPALRRRTAGWSTPAGSAGRTASASASASRYTRALLNAALSGALLDVEYHTDPVFGFEVPKTLPRRAGQRARPGRVVAEQGRVHAASTGSWPRASWRTSRSLQHLKIADSTSKSRWLVLRSEPMTAPSYRRLATVVERHLHIAAVQGAIGRTGVLGIGIEARHGRAGAPHPR